eukprot:gene12095-8320_t
MLIWFILTQKNGESPLFHKNLHAAEVIEKDGVSSLWKKFRADMESKSKNPFQGAPFSVGEALELLLKQGTLVEVQKQYTPVSLILFCGLPLSGKSTIAQVFLKDFSTALPFQRCIYFSSELCRMPLNKRVVVLFDALRLTEIDLMLLEKHEGDLRQLKPDLFNIWRLANKRHPTPNHLSAGHHILTIVDLRLPALFVSILHALLCFCYTFNSSSDKFSKFCFCEYKNGLRREFRKEAAAMMVSVVISAAMMVSVVISTAISAAMMVSVVISAAMMVSVVISTAMMVSVVISTAMMVSVVISAAMMVSVVISTAMMVSVLISAAMMVSVVISTAMMVSVVTATITGSLQPYELHRSAALRESSGRSMLKKRCDNGSSTFRKTFSQDYLSF